MGAGPVELPLVLRADRHPASLLHVGDDDGLVHVGAVGHLGCHGGADCPLCWGRAGVQQSELGHSLSSQCLVNNISVRNDKKENTKTFTFSSKDFEDSISSISPRFRKSAVVNLL